MKRRNEGFRFFAEDFWSLMKRQKGKCALTGRQLTPDNTEVELRDPFAAVKERSVDDHYLILRSIAAMARYASEKEIIECALDIVRERGQEFGFELRKRRRR